MQDVNYTKMEVAFLLAKLKLKGFCLDSLKAHEVTKLVEMAAKIEEPN